MSWAAYRASPGFYWVSFGVVHAFAWALLIGAADRLGRSVLDALMKAARARGDHEVVLHAQLSAAPFYARAGFSERGLPFDEAGIPHIEMARAL